MTRFRAWADGLSAVEKALGAGVGLGGTAVTLALMLMGYVGLPDLVRTEQSVNAQQAAQIDSLKEAGQARDRRILLTDLKLEYTICLLEYLSGEGRRTSTQCAADFANARP